MSTIKYLNPWATTAADQLVYFEHTGRREVSYEGCDLYFNPDIPCYDFVFEGVCFMQVDGPPELDEPVTRMQAFCDTLKLGMLIEPVCEHLEHKINSAVLTYKKARELLDNV